MATDRKLKSYEQVFQWRVLYRYQYWSDWFAEDVQGSIYVYNDMEKLEYRVVWIAVNDD